MSKLRNQILAGTAALFWAIWLCRNDMVFNRTPITSFLQVIFRATYWIRSCSPLFKEEERETMRTGCTLLETTVMEIFSKFGWKRSLRLNV
ncbi:hypothetical protein BS78_K280700 [Paspalum vaginatum]|uniref:Uncharacterized protein n=1 Tax=Paspalum vaginatum TaxID=158149 RepID=A0A9W8CEV9_9POAL|nr:hypothetical protein BS78_K280700 [Paspalum vaginatum]